MYESLRAEVLDGHARPDGLVHGLALLEGSIRTGMSVMPRSSPLTVVTGSRELLHVIANMVLQTQSEVMHVY